MSDDAAVLDLAGFVQKLESPPLPPEADFRPWRVRLVRDELARLRSLCERRRLTLIDNMDRQLEELTAFRALDTPSVETREPSRNDLRGNWIYLPWEAKVVHVLSREDYFDVITSRNQDKITRAEQRLLRSKRIGVIGLSVGAEAAVSVAQEGLCGSMALADFDRLDLSNLNRINAGIDELGENKARIVARRIARINPYLDVTVYDNGVKRDNMVEFIDGLDLLIEECDDLQAKHDVRLHARRLGVNVVYAADERGFLSIEPYRDWPELEPFHGRVEAPQPPREMFETPFAFMQALTLWLGGWDNISKRSQRSVQRIGDTLGGYPQLASEARYAAGQVGHVARRLLLGEKLPPYLGNLDLEEFVPSV